jgi:hypothetical protein
MAMAMAMAMCKKSWLDTNAGKASLLVLLLILDTGNSSHPFKELIV